MRRGGNAVDAAVTCAFVQGVIDPQMCSIGGCGAMLVHSAQGGDALLEFYGTAGSRTREDQWEPIFIREAADRYGYVLEGWVNDVGYQSVGVPGTVAGLAEALRRHGTISWAEAVRPAIPLARDGVPVSGFVHGSSATDSGPAAGRPDAAPDAELPRAPRPLEAGVALCGGGAPTRRGHAVRVRRPGGVPGRPQVRPDPGRPAAGQRARRHPRSRRDDARLRR